MAERWNKPWSKPIGRCWDDAWEIMTSVGRSNLLRQLDLVLEREKLGWDGSSIEELADIDAFDFIPPNLQGFLIIAYTPDGWDFNKIKEWKEFVSLG